MFHLILGIHLVLCIALIGLVLLQQGKGANMGAAFGGSNSSTLFGAAGAGTVLTKVTTFMAIGFMVTSIFLVRHYASLADSTEGIVTVDPLAGSVMEKQAASEKAVVPEENNAAQTGVVPPAAQNVQPQEKKTEAQSSSATDKK